MEKANPWLAADLRDAANQKHVVAELRRQLNAADIANLAKGRFLETASHDLREPLQSLFLLNCTLRGIVREPEAAGALRQQENAILAMSRLLSTLLDGGGHESAVTASESPTQNASRAEPATA